MCGLTIPTNWDDKPAEISQKNWNNMRSVYTNVTDIDAFTGSVSEKSVAGGIVGPTIACILGTQFKNLKEGDRFFFSHPSDGSNNEKGLSATLRTLVRNRRLSDVFCNNIQGEESIKYESSLTRIILYEFNYFSVKLNVMDIQSATVDCSLVNPPAFSQKSPSIQQEKGR